MNNNLKKLFNKANKTLALSFMALVFGITLFFGFSNHASAKPSDHILYGFAWSDNIGWISLNCADRNICSTSNYSVVIDYTTGQLSGYGWSSNVGWVSFNASDTGGCPDTYNNSGPCRPTAVLSSSGTYSGAFPHIIGWAKATVASTMTSGAWDGWISLSCHNTDTCATSNYGVILPNDGVNAIPATSGTFTGYAWGSTVSGWIDFSEVTVLRGSSELTLVASDPNDATNSPISSVADNATPIRLTYDTPTSTNYDRCDLSGGDVDWNATINSPITFPDYKDVLVPNDPTTFVIECTAGTKTDTASITIDIDYVWGITMTATPNKILANGNSRVSWATTGNVPVGTVCGALGGWTSSKAQSGYEDINNIASTTSYSYQCVPPDPNDTKTASVNVNVLKVTFEPDACYTASNGGPEFSWSSIAADSCKITGPGPTVYVNGIKNFGKKIFPSGDGTYTIECSALTNVGTTITVSDSISTVACVPSYSINDLGMCNGKPGQLTDNSFQPSGPTQYKSLVKVDSKPEFGFSSQLKYKFTAPANWISNGWTIGGGWLPTGNPGEYESPNAFYSSTLEITAPNLASLATLNGFTNKTQTFTIFGDTEPSIPMVKQGTFSVCPPDGGSSKPIFIEQ